MKRYHCPCCGESLLVHVRGSSQVGFCSNCYQEMPLIAQHENLEKTLTISYDYHSNLWIDNLLKKNENLNEIIQNSRDGVWIISQDQLTLFANQKLAQTLGYTIEEIQTKPFWTFIDEPHPISQVLNSNQPLTQPEEYEIQLLHKEGYWVWVRLCLTSLIGEDSQYQGYLLQVFDLTYLKQIEHQLRQQNKREEALSRILQVTRSSGRLETIFSETVAQLGNVLPVASVQIMQYQPTNKAWVNRAEYQDKINRLKGNSDLETPLIPTEYCDQISSKKITVTDLEEWSLPLKISTIQSQNSELVIDDKRVEEFLQYCPGAWLPIPLYCESSIWGCLSLVRESPNYHWQQSDQTFIQAIADQLSIAICQAELDQQLEQARLKFQTLSTLDQLTQLPNRYYFNQYLDQTWQQLSYDQQHLTIILCHVDRFSYYQKTYGDRSANECLKQIAFIMRSSLTHRDQMVARYAQTEFVLLLPKTESTEAVKFIETLQVEIEQITHHPLTDSTELIPSVSFGIASQIPRLGSSPKQLLANAEQALDAGASPLCKCLLV